MESTNSSFSNFWHHFGSLCYSHIIYNLDCFFTWGLEDLSPGRYIRCLLGAPLRYIHASYDIKLRTLGEAV